MKSCKEALNLFVYPTVSSYDPYLTPVAWEIRDNLVSDTPEEFIRVANSIRQNHENTIFDRERLLRALDTIVKSVVEGVGQENFPTLAAYELAK